MSERVADQYLLDFGQLLREHALAAKQQETDARGTEDHQFQLGRLTAYYEIVTLMQQQAVAFDLPLEALGLSGFDPDRDLLTSMPGGA